MTLIPVPRLVAVTAVLSLVTVLVLAACSSDADPIAFQRGNTLWVQVHDIRLKDAVFYRDGDVIYTVRASRPGHKLAVVDATVGNNRSTTVLMDVKEDGFTLLAKDGQEYDAINPFESRELAPNPPQGEPLGVFIWGNFEIAQGYAIRAWALFEVPEDIEPSQFRWDTVETVFVRDVPFN
ncbi:MAG: hypothetical protein V3V35_09200 [Dehalococcoidia bacterium]